MKKTLPLLLFLASFSLLSLNACDRLANTSVNTSVPPATTPSATPTAEPSSSPSITPSPTASPSEAPIFTIQIPLDAAKTGFELKSAIQLSIYPCSSSGYPSASPAIRPCALGEKPLYQQSFSAQAAATTLTLQVPGLKLGDTIEVSGTGHDRGQCNNIGGRKALTLTATAVEVPDFPWATTDLACVFKATVKGKILDQNQRPVENAKIEAKSLQSAVPYQETVYSDPQGHYQLNQVPEIVPIEISFSKAGYVAQTQQKTLNPTTQEAPPLTINDLDFVLVSNS